MAAEFAAAAALPRAGWARLEVEERAGRVGPCGREREGERERREGVLGAVGSRSSGWD